MRQSELRQSDNVFEVIPVSTDMIADTLTPVSAYLRLRGSGSHSFLFESVEGTERLARYSIIGTSPAVALRCRRNVTTVTSEGGHGTTGGNFFDTLRRELARYRCAEANGPLPFVCGFVGYIGYDMIHQIEKVRGASDELPRGDVAHLELFTSLIIFDHARHRILLTANAIVKTGAEREAACAGARKELERLRARLEGPLPEVEPFRPSGITAAWNRTEFCEAVRRAQRYIYEGDIFQAVLSQSFTAGFTGDPFAAFRALRIINPSPYLYYIDFGDETVIGSSPEVLVRNNGGRCEVYPIAGTRRRGNTEEEDRHLEAELLADEKERAEHIMLVDLGRNDLGRVCVPGSVRVDESMSVVRYSHVMHMASRVCGQLAPERDCVDLFRAAFPAGTVSGAPKIRAMEIIAELEREPRGLYAGGVGYFDCAGNMDMCIAIRTMVTSGNRLSFRAGAGIVADSDPDAEYRETISKSRALTEALQLAERIV